MHPQICKLSRRTVPYCFTLALLACPPLQAGTIEITSGGTQVEENTFHLNVDAAIELPASVRDALDKGVDLFFSTDVKIVRIRKWLPPKAALNIKIIRRLGFHALTRKYVVDDLTLGKRKSFTSVSEALAYLGRYRKVPLVSKTVIKPSPDTQVRMRIKLMPQELPTPLRLKRIFSPAWRLSSDWYAWSLK